MPRLSDSARRLIATFVAAIFVLASTPLTHASPMASRSGPRLTAFSYVANQAACENCSPTQGDRKAPCKAMLNCIVSSSCVAWAALPSAAFEISLAAVAERPSWPLRTSGPSVVVPPDSRPPKV